jgi:conjugal transfer pilus assembly protein TraV
MSLGGCATFGGNVKGSFSCAAPDGICAPSSNIDDRALAMISGDETEGGQAPAGGAAPRGTARANRASALQPARLAAAGASRTREKVLRIVFQPYIDERGRLHEASAVHAVVASGDWQQASAFDAVRPGSAGTALLAVPESLADAVERVDPPADLVTVDPTLPDPAAVAAARARKPDPVSAIKADVTARLAPKREPQQRRDKRRAIPQSASAPAVTPPATMAPPAPQSAPSAAAAPPATSGSGMGRAAATDRIKSDAAYQAAAAALPKGARDAAAQTGAAPVAPGGTVKAASFPAAVPEDK